MEDVRVHRNSPEPAKVAAFAYARGGDIHIGPGQEKHLPHEAWHVVQQKQGRVPPTTRPSGLPVNEDQALEAEADRMSAVLGASATAGKMPALSDIASKPARSSAPPIQLQKPKKKAPPPPENIIEQLSRQGFSQLLEAQKLNEEINGKAAKALASAYLSNFVASSQAAPIAGTPTSATTTYLTTAVAPDPPSLEEVYTAILSLMHVTNQAGGKNADVWKWTAAPGKAETRRDVIVEIAEWGGGEVVGYATDEIRDSAIRRVAGKAADSAMDKMRDKLLKDIGVRAVVTWEAGIGLQIVAEVSLLVLNVVGWLAIAVSVAKLLKMLMRSPQRVPTRQDQILADVVQWLAGAAKSEPPRVPDNRNAYQENSRDNVRPGGVEDRVNLNIKMLEETKIKKDATLRNMKNYEASKNPR